MPMDYRGFSRRRLLAGTAAGTAFLAMPSIIRAQTQSLKIAVLLPQSGYLAQAGQSCHRGALVAPAVLADFGHKVELMHIDMESNPDVARTQTERAINEGAQCVVGAFDSAGTLAIAQVCEQRQVPLIVNIGAAPQLDRTGLQVPGAQFSDRRHAGQQRPEANQGADRGHQGRAQDRGVPARQR